MKRIYLDYASLTPIDKRVAKYVRKFETMDYGNPSALYSSAVAAKKALLEAREKIAKVLHAHGDEILFTASGTEANNLALNWVPSGKHIMVSAIEHSSIIETARALEKRGVKVSYIPVDSNGLVDIEFIKKEIRPETVLISVMMVNNEIGTIEPLQEIAKIVRHARKSSSTPLFPLLHTDACQAPCILPIHVEKIGFDLITLDSHKVYGPRGVGMLYIKREVQREKILTPIIYGGGQEKGLRSGTENIPGIAGFSIALELAEKMRDKEVARLIELKKYFIENLLKINSAIKINGPINGTIENSAPHIVNISIPNIDNEFLVLKLDAHGIECSTKSACLQDEDESYVLRNVGADSKTSLRFSFGRITTKNELKKVFKAIIL